ncbi:hypothetical protein [Salinarimonas ramus]|uniref:REase AHJR-like domain-containing protein n=1 Tax=Salinarimonas ramus TaxID=690164 RepID=A0A917Q4S1_9HYPH|nr:hypothetical protein [Salinarimonas ramus]GGK26207.1 hypothetical protein GCM10011322_10730 [Salinarimonas ramus]
MTIGTRTRAELLAAAGRRLSAEGYDIIVAPDTSLLPEALRARRPDAIAIGRDPKLVVEIASEDPQSASRMAALREALRAEPGWKLHVVLDRASPTSTMPVVDDDDIGSALQRVAEIAPVAPSAALMLAWSSLEALVRVRRPETFARSQVAARIVEHLAAEGIVLPEDADFLRTMAQLRNAVAHGDLTAAVEPSAVDRLVALARDLASSPDLADQRNRGIDAARPHAPSPSFAGR